MSKNPFGSRDLFNECRSGTHAKMPPATFRNTFCNHCRNRECVNAGWAATKWDARMERQEELITHPQFANPDLPQYAQIPNWGDLSAKAWAIIEADRRGDWSRPSPVPEIHVHDGVPQESSQTQAVENAVRSLRGKEPLPEEDSNPPEEGPELEVIEEEVIEEEVIEEEAPAPPPRPPKPPPRKAGRVNTRVPKHGMMIGAESHPETQVPKQTADPWAPKQQYPKPPANVVRVRKLEPGGKVKIKRKPKDDTSE